MRFLLSLLVVVGMVGMMYAAPKHQQNDLFCTICQKLIDEIRPFVNATDVEKIANGICDDITFGMLIEIVQFN